MQFKFLLVDIETSGVLCSTESISAANSIAQGILNVKVGVVPMYHFWTNPKWKDINFDSHFVQYDDTNGPEIHNLDSHLITDDFTFKRNLAILRRRFFIRLEGFLNNVLFKTHFGFDETTASYIENQLIQSDPQTDKFSNALVEYAHYNNISENSAYDELKMLTESHGRMKLRLFACYTKYVKKINQTTDNTEMVSIYEEAMKDVFINARL